MVIIRALNSGITDFEDAVQIEASKANNINIIITRNTNDFRNSGLSIFGPVEYINNINNEIRKNN